MKFILPIKIKSMKIKKNVALSLVWWISLALWLWAMSVFAVDKQIKIDLTNIIQHMQRVVIIDKTSNNSATLKLSQGGMVWVDANNFIISQEWESINKIEGDSSYSNILWWERNLISWYTSTILWWKSNENRWNTSTILGWEWNRINAWNDSTIIWWSGNVLKWSGSVIAWWDANSVSGNYSVVVGNKTFYYGTKKQDIYSYQSMVLN